MILGHADGGDTVAVLAALALFWAMWRTRRPRDR